MTRFRAIPICLLSLIAASAAQNPPPHRANSPSASSRATAANKPTAADHWKEPLTIERNLTVVKFENDGTWEQSLRVRARVQSDAGAEQLRELVFRFNAANQHVDVRYVHVLKSDGTVVNGSADAVTETMASVAHDAAAYSDCKEKHIAVPPLAVGDTLEYEIATRLVKPDAPGEFWFAHTFVGGSIVLDERLEISVPETRDVILKSSASAPYETEHANGRTIYRWKRTNLKLSVDDSKKTESGIAATKSPDVELTTFANWQAVGRWYAKLTEGRSEPSSEIRAKTEELTREETSPLAKVQALYDFVSAKVRTVDLPLGQGSWTPHPAAEVFSNGYGDSADKHVLLAAMLKAAAIPADALLLPYTRKLDASVPSPAELDHVISAVPLGSGLICMDSTIEVAPFRLLASPLRNKSALLVAADGSGKIVQTPADPPFLSTQHVEIDGRVSELGKLTARVHYAMRGDTELVLRLAFHRTPQAQWNELAQTILSLDGIHGQVASVKPSDPLATHDPFELEIDLAQPGFLDWSSKRAATPLPLLVIGLPDLPAAGAKPVELGSPLNVDVKLTLYFPAAYAVQPPASAAVARDYAEFRSSYGFADHALTAERSLNFKMRGVPSARADDYRDFSRAVTADQNRVLLVTNTAPGEPVVPSSATADETVEAGLALLNAGNPRAAIPLFGRAVELDPRHLQAWSDLGLADLRYGKLDDAAAAFRKQIEINPADEHANEYLGIALERENKNAEAAEAFRRQIKLTPLDAAAYAALGATLLARHDYAQAAPVLDKATILSPENVQLEIDLGRAYANMGEEAKALAAFETAAARSPTPLVWNDIAFNLADSKIALDQARHYAELAVDAIGADLRSADSQHPATGELRAVASLAGCWDTLGWVYFQKGDLEMAERYIRPAWLLGQDGEVGDHLAQIYEKRGDQDAAIRTYALALAAPDAVPESRARLTLLLGGNSRIDELVTAAKPELAALGAIPAGKLPGVDAEADFFLVISPAGKSARADSVRFISGSEKLRLWADRLRALDYGPAFPDVSPLKIVRRGTLACVAKTGDCTFRLLRAADVRAAE